MFLKCERRLASAYTLLLFFFVCISHGQNQDFQRKFFLDGQRADGGGPRLSLGRRGDAGGCFPFQLAYLDPYTQALQPGFSGRILLFCLQVGVPRVYRE